MSMKRHRKDVAGMLGGISSSILRKATERGQQLESESDCGCPGFDFSSDLYYIVYDFSFTQTIFHNLKEIRDMEPIRQGYGEGSFVVIRAKK